MKILKPALLIAAALIGLLLCETAWAHPGGHYHGGHGYSGHVLTGNQGQWRGGGHHYHHSRGYWRGGVFIAAPLGWYGDPFYDPFYRSYYVGRPLWYYCDFPRGYYPQVLACSVPWHVLSAAPWP